jgi:hypothetical protein
MKTTTLLCLALVAAGFSSCAGRYELVPHEGKLYRMDRRTGQLWRARLSRPTALDQNGQGTYPPGFPKVKWELIEEVTSLEALDATPGEKYPELQETLRHEVEAGRMTKAQAEEVLAQREEFEERRPEIEARYPGKVVAVANGAVYVGDTLTEAQDQVPEGRLSYVEQIPAVIQPATERDKKKEGARRE